jgi:hypothetical protein
MARENEWRRGNEYAARREEKNPEVFLMTQRG